jgi:hypothetical protein
MVAYGELASLLRSDLSGTDPLGLARWTYMTLSGTNGELTMILVGYKPCRSPDTYLSSLYQIQQAYYTLASPDSTCPHRWFDSDLLSMLKEWRLAGRRLIVCLDANDHVYNSRLRWALTSDPDLNLREVIHTHTGQPLSATHFHGSRPIDAIWTTPDLGILNACAMPIGYGAGDHRPFIIDFRTSSMVGHTPQPVKRPLARRLNTKIPHCADAYNTILEKHLLYHRIPEKLTHLHHNPQSTNCVKATLDSIDTVTTACMKHAERHGSPNPLFTGSLPLDQTYLMLPSTTPILGRKSME